MHNGRHVAYKRRADSSALQRGLALLAATFAFAAADRMPAAHASALENGSSLLPIA
jgi:hypothetical protein